MQDDIGGYWDDNFGHYDMSDSPEETVAFYNDVQRRNVEKTCVCCGRRVMILPHYDKCGSCADKIERGWDF